MNTTSADNTRDWIVISDEKPAALEIVLLKKSVVLSWNQFLYAEGSDEEVRAVFATHDVIVRGSGLTPLMSDLAAQRVSALKEPIRPDRFSGALVRLIREIVVHRADGGHG